MWYLGTALEFPAWFRPLNLEMRKILIISCATRMQLTSPEATSKTTRGCHTIQPEVSHGQMLPSLFYSVGRNIQLLHVLFPLREYQLLAFQTVQ